MKKSLCIVLGLFIVLSFASLSEARVATALFTDKAPAIDGKLDDSIWSKVSPVEYGDHTGASDAKIAIYLAWDNDYFYWAFKVVDNDFFGFLEDENTQVWNNDDVEWYIETDNAKATTRTDKTFQLCLGVGGGYNFTIGGTPLKIDQRSDSTLAYTWDGNYDDEEEDNYWIVEGKTPWRRMNVTPEKGMIMGFSSTTFDRDFSGKKISFFGWADYLTESNNHNPSMWGELELK